MLPLLYNQDTLDSEFGKNGLGFIRNCTKCIATEERNSMYELDLELLPNDRLAGGIAPGMFVKAKANPFDPPQIFEIYQMSASDTLIKAKGQHFKYIANGSIVSETYASQIAKTPIEAWNAVQFLLEPKNILEFYSDITTKGIVTAAKDYPVRLGDFLMGKKGSMLDVFGGEFHYDNFKIELLESRGSFSGAAIRYGSNISSYTQDSDISTVYTHLLPFATVRSEYFENGRDAGNRTIYGDTIELNNNYLFYERALSYDFSDEFGGEDDKLIVYQRNESYQNWAEMKAKLEQKAANYVNKNESALTDVSVNITVDVEDALNQLQNCRLCDTVRVYFEPLGYSTTAKIIKTQYDSLQEKYCKIELGKMKKTIADLFDGKNIGGV